MASNESNPEKAGETFSPGENQKDVVTVGVAVEGGEEVMNDYGNLSSFPVTPRAATSGEKIAIPPQSIPGEEFVQELRQKSPNPSTSPPPNRPLSSKGILAQISSHLASTATPPKMSFNYSHGSGSDGEQDKEQEQGFLDQEDNSLDLSYEDSLEDGTLRHMKTSGFMSQLKGEIAKYMFDITKSSLQSFVIPERADKEVLAQIYDYLIWVGMRSTAAVLLSETPIPFPSPSKEQDQETEGQEPLLATLLTKIEQKPSTTIITTTDQISQTPTSSKTDMGNQTPTVPESSKEDLSLKKSVSEVTTVENTTLSRIEDVHQAISATVVNKQLSKPHLTTSAGDLLTGSPLSSPAPSSVVTQQMPSVQEQEETIIPLCKKESFDELLHAYVGNVEEKQKISTLVGGGPATSTSIPEESPKTPPPSSPENNLMAFTFTSTPLRGEREPEDIHKSRTEAEIPKFSLESTQDKLQERSFFSKKIEKEQEPTTSSAESDESSSFLSSSPAAPAPLIKKEEDQKLEINPEESKNEKKIPSDGKSEVVTDISTSDALSMDLEELENDNTMDVSLPSDAQGMSICDHVVNIKE